MVSKSTGVRLPSARWRRRRLYLVSTQTTIARRNSWVCSDLFTAPSTGVPGHVLLISLAETDNEPHISLSITTMSFCGRESGTEITRAAVDSISEGNMP